MKKVCPKCKALNGENADKCRVCGYVFTAEDNYAPVKSHRTFTPKYSGTFSTIAVVIGVAFGVIGIILGALSAEEGFNVMLALYTLDHRRRHRADLLGRVLPPCRTRRNRSRCSRRLATISLRWSQRRRNKPRFSR